MSSDPSDVALFPTFLSVAFEEFASVHCFSLITHDSTIHERAPSFLFGQLTNSFFLHFALPIATAAARMIYPTYLPTPRRNGDGLWVRLRCFITM